MTDPFRARRPSDSPTVSLVILALVVAGLVLWTVGMATGSAGPIWLAVVLLAAAFVTSRREDRTPRV